MIKPFINRSSQVPKRSNDFNQYRPVHFDKIKQVSVAKETHQNPQSDREPGHLRIDVVYQGSQDQNKGLYHINVIDEVTRFEVVYSIEKISENYLIPVLEIIMETFPFNIKKFRSDNSSDYSNRTVLKLLNKLWVEFITLRARQPRDTGLVNSRPAPSVRKTLGYIHIPQKHAEKINEFNKRYWIPYSNFHRPCFFDTGESEKKGKKNKE